MRIAGAVLFPLLVIGAVIFGPSFFHSEDYAFTQLMGFIKKGDTRASVRWTYIRHRASPMRLTTERLDVWGVSGRWRGEPAHLVIRFSGTRVESVSLELLPNKPAAGNAGIAPQLTIGRHWPGVGEPDRSTSE
jgi:hypothetical protein